MGSVRGSAGSKEVWFGLAVIQKVEESARRERFMSAV